MCGMLLPPLRQLGQIGQQKKWLNQRRKDPVQVPLQEKRFGFSYKINGAHTGMRSPDVPMLRDARSLLDFFIVNILAFPVTGRSVFIGKILYCYTSFGFTLTGILLLPHKILRRLLKALVGVHENKPARYPEEKYDDDEYEYVFLHGGMFKV